MIMTNEQCTKFANHSLFSAIGEDEEADAHVMTDPIGASAIRFACPLLQPIRQPSSSHQSSRFADEQIQSICQHTPALLLIAKI